MDLLLKVFAEMLQSLVTCIDVCVHEPTRWLWSLIAEAFTPEPDIDQKVAKFCKDGSGGLSNRELLDKLYFFLGILDSKAAALMQYDGIILAVAGIIIQSHIENASLLNAIKYATYCTIVSILFCLPVVGVFWRFLAFVKPGCSDPLAVELHKIKRILKMREFAYQVAWWLAVVAGVMLLLNVQGLIDLAKKDADHAASASGSAKIENVR
ncbi:hypothetical protein [Methylocystis sp.]|uniref:hypothetical protein n=1 Tax=Methylocystis sp. TaxID=1911079 RepID=UPI003D12C738